MDSMKEQSLVLLLPPEKGKTAIIQIPSESNSCSRTETMTNFCLSPFTSDTGHACSDVVAPNVDVEGPGLACCKHNTFLATYVYKIGFDL